MIATDYGALLRVVIGKTTNPNSPALSDGEGYARQMSVLLVTDERFLDHHPGNRHPEQPDRLEAVWSGLGSAGLQDAIVRREPVAASEEDLLRCHGANHLAELTELDHLGGGRVDPDTAMSSGSWLAARLAAGAGLEAVAALRAGVAHVGFCAVRPPGHHATPKQAMGFCLINNVAVTASFLVNAGERVAIVDIDAHHGNGTQEAFYDDPRVLFVSLHQWPLYPGTGAEEEMGVGEGIGATINLAMPARAAGNSYRYGFDRVVIPAVERFSPDWLLVSAGFDAHRDDPLTDLGLTSGDYADLTTSLVALVPRGRCVLFLEGGYDLEALANSSGASIAAAIGVKHRPEPASGDGPGSESVDRAVEMHGLDG